jgi:hypothetical protein
VCGSIGKSGRSAEGGDFDEAGLGVLRDRTNLPICFDLWPISVRNGGSIDVSNIYFLFSDWTSDK